jgi:hypothetical protein
MKLRFAAFLFAALLAPLAPSCNSDRAAATALESKPPTPAPEPKVVDVTARPVPGSVDKSGAPGVIHGDKWQDDDDQGSGGGKASVYKETFVYVDGEPKGAMIIPELPDIPVAWSPDVISLDFVRGQPGPREKKTWLRRWRLTDYLKAIGVNLSKVKVVYLHGGSGVIEVPGDVLRKYADGLRFDLTGNDMTKSRFFFPQEMPRFGRFDRYVAVSVIVDKAPLKVTGHKELEQDGVIVTGIPYHGAPERGGIRIYRDGVLALNIKRNTLGAAGRVAPTEPRWNFEAILKSNGASIDEIAAADIVYAGARKRMTGEFFKGLEFGTNSQASGEILLGKSAEPANSILLYSKGKVPKVVPPAPFEQDHP